MGIVNRTKKWIFQKKWRRANTHNSTCVETLFPQELVSVGRCTYGPLRVFSFDTSSRLQIGSFCSIAPEVTFMLSADHRTDSVSTFPFRVKVMGEALEGVSRGNISVGDDVWIGYRSVILSGVRIGQGAVIGAGAVVTRDVPPYGVVGGVPARLIRYRFPEAVTNYLMTLDYAKLDEDMLKRHVRDLYLPIDQMELETVRELYDWFPKREPVRDQEW